ncbi:hypothetical protein ACHAXS_010883 [Conticribra weissflogii]
MEEDYFKHHRCNINIEQVVFHSHDTIITPLVPDPNLTIITLTSSLCQRIMDKFTISAPIILAVAFLVQSRLSSIRIWKVSAFGVHLDGARKPHPHFSPPKFRRKHTMKMFVKNHIQATYSRPLQTTSANDIDSSANEERVRAKLGRVPIISRKIPIEIEIPSEPIIGKERDENNYRNTGEGIIKKRFDITIWEMEKPSELIQAWWTFNGSERQATGDPFGTVMWPGSILASMEMMRQHYFHNFSQFSTSEQHETISIHPFKNATVLILGAGTGVEAQTAALLGAKKVVATDINQFTLRLLDYGAKRMVERFRNVFGKSMDGVIEARYFDLFSEMSLPESDIIIAADVLYNPELATQVGRRIYEAISQNDKIPKLIVTDSQKFHGTDFLVEVTELKELSSLLKERGLEQLQWEMRQLKQVCASGVLVDEDQTYDVDVRMICWGWESQ